MHGLTRLLFPPAQLSRITLSLGIVLIGFGSLASLQAGDIVELADLLAHPDQYDKQAVAVVGEVADLQTATTRDGQSAYGFLLKAGGGTVKVIGLGKTAVRDGAQVVVEGTFNRLRQGGRTVVLNEIKAELVRPLARLIPDFVG
jgi:hypothetical protein